MSRPYHFSDAGRLAHKAGCSKGGNNARGIIKSHSSEQARAAARPPALSVAQNGRSGIRYCLSP